MGKPSPYESLPLLKSHTAEAYVVRPTVALVFMSLILTTLYFYIAQLTIHREVLKVHGTGCCYGQSTIQKVQDHVKALVSENTGQICRKWILWKGNENENVSNIYKCTLDGFIEDMLAAKIAPIIDHPSFKNKKSTNLFLFPRRQKHAIWSYLEINHFPAI